MQISKDLMQDIIEALIKAGCQFSQCDGYDSTPIDMLTCHRCYALYKIFKRYPQLKNK